MIHCVITWAHGDIWISCATQDRATCAKALFDLPKQLKPISKMRSFEVSFPCIILEHRNRLDFLSLDKFKADIPKIKKDIVKNRPGITAFLLEGEFFSSPHGFDQMGNLKNIPLTENSTLLLESNSEEDIVASFNK